VRCRIPGESIFHDLYRGELGGIFAAIVVTELLRKFTGIDTVVFLEFVDDAAVHSSCTFFCFGVGCFMQDMISM
jgi:hypothetical protein